MRPIVLNEETPLYDAGPLRFYKFDDGGTYRLCIAYDLPGIAFPYIHTWQQDKGTEINAFQVCQAFLTIMQTVHEFKAGEIA